MFILKGMAGLDRVFRTSAICYDETTRATLQKGGFVYLEYSYSAANSANGTVLPVAKIADGLGTNALKKKLVYPVLIDRAAPGSPRTDFNPINESGLITIMLGTTVAFVNKDSYYIDNSTYADINPGDALKIVKIATATLVADSNYGAAYVYDRPMLVKGDGAFDTTLAYAMTGVVNGEIQIKWLG